MQKRIFIILAVIVLVIVAIPAVWLLTPTATPLAPQTAEHQVTKVAQQPNTVQGQFSREIFSGNTFEYTTAYDDAVFTFHPDGTFEAVYRHGVTYRGTFSVYNGLYIATKADEIEENPDPALSDGQANHLVNDMRNVFQSMMSRNPGNITNIYFLYLHATEVQAHGEIEQEDILQPFMIDFNEETNSGTMINIFAQVQGTLTMR